MNTVAQARDWQQLSADGLAGLSLDRLPAAELLFLDGLAAYLMGPDAPESPCTIEHGTVIVGHLLRALVDCSMVKLEDSPQCTAEMSEAQTRSLFYYGLLAVASGPNNRLAQEAADGIVDVFKAWDGQIGDGFVPPWRLVAAAAASTAINLDSSPSTGCPPRGPAST